MARKKSRKGRRKAKFLSKTRSKLKSSGGKLKSQLKKNATLKSLKPYTKAGFALTATGLAYATTYTVAKGIGQTLLPNATYKTDAWLTNTDLGLVTQTGLIVGSTGLAIKFLESQFGKTVVPNFFSRFKDERKIMIAGSTAFATGRLLTGLSKGHVGKRFQALFDADLPAFIYTAQAPYFNRPSNIRAMNEVIRGDLSDPSVRPGLTDRFFNLFSPRYGSWVAGRNPSSWSKTHRVNIPSGIDNNFNYMNFKTNRPLLPNNVAPVSVTPGNNPANNPANNPVNNPANNPAAGNGLNAQLAKPIVNQVSQNRWERGNNTTSAKHKFTAWNTPHNHHTMMEGNAWGRGPRGRYSNDMTQQNHNELHQNGYTNLSKYTL